MLMLLFTTKSLLLLLTYTILLSNQKEKFHLKNDYIFVVDGFILFNKKS